MDLCASRKSPERFDPAMIPGKWRENQKKSSPFKNALKKINKKILYLLIYSFIYMFLYVLMYVYVHTHTLLWYTFVLLCYSK